jgi:hypothetical protein
MGNRDATDVSGPWAIETVDSYGDVGYFASIAIDSSDNVHIGYQDTSLGDLKYATNAQQPAPAPDIKANGSDGAITISQSEKLSVTVELNLSTRASENADWWVVAETPFEWYYYDVNRDSWKPGLICTYGGPLFDLPPYDVLNMSGLPTGDYTFYFGVDMVMNGSLDMSDIYYDSVEVEITPC